MTTRRWAKVRRTLDLRFMILAAAALAVVSLRAAPASTTRPEDVGLSSDRLQRITQLNERYIGEKRLSGAVSLVARRGRVD